jgi:hypothetical protein
MSGPAKRTFTSFVRPAAVPPAAEAPQSEPPPQPGPPEAEAKPDPGEGQGADEIDRLFKSIIRPRRPAGPSADSSESSVRRESVSIGRSLELCNLHNLRAPHSNGRERGQAGRKRRAGRSWSRCPRRHRAAALRDAPLLGQAPADDSAPLQYHASSIGPPFSIPATVPQSDKVYEHAQTMAAHESPRTTKLYDRTKDRLTQAQV